MATESDKTRLNNGLDAQKVLLRVPGAFTAVHDKLLVFTFDNRDRKYDSQYFSMYQYRLSTLKQRVDENAALKWGRGDKKVDGQVIEHKEKILDIENNKLCWVSGTVFSDMKNKLNILNDVENGTDDVLPENPQSYIGATASSDLPLVMLEDELGRAILHNDGFLRKNVLVTGCIIAVLGIEVQAGVFEIMDVVYPTISPQKPLLGGTEGKIAILSGLGLKNDTDYDLKAEILKEYLLGELGGIQDRANASKITGLVIAGNSIAAPELVQDAENDASSTTFGSKNTSRFDTGSLKVFNDFLSDILATIPVTVMPGPQDPAEICLPQQKLHLSLFGGNKKYLGGSLTAATNPCWLENDHGLRILGTSGQNIDDLKRYLPVDVLEQPAIATNLLEATLRWQNIMPTAPDTLYCYPFEEYDPFVLADETPHVYFAGNQDIYGTKEVELEGHKVRVVSVPRFCDLGEVVLVDVKTLETEVVRVGL